MVENIWAINGGIYLAFPVDRTEGLPPNFAGQRPLQIVTDRQMVVVAPNGSGKSRRVILPQLAALLGWSIAVVDFKGELAAGTAQYRRDHGSEVIILNPFNALGLGSHGFNPVAALDLGDELVDDAVGMAESIITIEGNDPHWPGSAQDLLAAMIMYSRLADEGGGSLGEVRRRIGQTSLSFKQDVQAMMRLGAEMDYPELFAKAARFRDISPEHEELNSILSNTSTNTRWLDSRRVQRDLAKGAFKWAEMRERPITAYLVLPGNRLSHRAWLRLMLTSIIQQLMKTVEKSKVPVLLILDEASQLAGLPITEENMAMFRGYGIKILSVYQDIPQAKLALGKRYMSYLANAGVFIALGACQDDETAAALSRRTGQTTAQVMGYSTSPDAARAGDQGGKLNISQAKIPVMLPQDIMNMDDGFALVWTHQTKGTLRSYFPDPSQLPLMREIVARMP